jgi:hypothetical protein
MAVSSARRFLPCRSPAPPYTCTLDIILLTPTPLTHWQYIRCIAHPPHSTAEWVPFIQQVGHQNHMWGNDGPMKREPSGCVVRGRVHSQMCVDRSNSWCSPWKACLGLGVLIRAAWLQWWLVCPWTLLVAPWTLTWDTSQASEPPKAQGNTRTSAKVNVVEWVFLRSTLIGDRNGGGGGARYALCLDNAEMFPR